MWVSVSGSHPKRRISKHLRANFVSSPELGYKLSDKVTIRAAKCGLPELGYKLSDKVTWSVGANNLFDTYPDRNGIVASDGSDAYGSFAPFGLSGGSHYTRVGVTF
jgi:hypothetical protein